MLVLIYTNTLITIATYNCRYKFTQSLVYHNLTHAPRTEFVVVTAFAAGLRVLLITLDSSVAETYFAPRFQGQCQNPTP
jgi:hypothetical protein